MANDVTLVSSVSANCGCDSIEVEGCVGCVPYRLIIEPDCCTGGAARLRWINVATGECFSTDPGFVRGVCTSGCADVVLTNCAGGILGYAYSKDVIDSGCAITATNAVELKDCTGNVIGYISAVQDTLHTIEVSVGCSTGTLIGYVAASGCVDTDNESDVIAMCDNGVTFLRHVMKKDGVPTGVKYDTTKANSPYAVSNESGVTIGECSATAVVQVIESDIVAMCDNGTTFLRHILKIDGVPTGVKYDTTKANASYTVSNESGVTIGECSATAVVQTIESDIVVMCDNGTTFLRHILKTDGVPTGGKNDTTMAGASYTVSNESNVTVGACSTSVCNGVTRQGVVTSW